ncbi:MAG: hypothetical protein V3V03_02450 [Hyphomonadaceae bacterium]
MFDAIQNVAGGFATVLLGIATGAAWIATIVGPNCSYDRLDASRADGHVRKLLVDASTPISGVLLAGGAFAVLGGSFGAAILSILAAFGFFSNRWTLASRKRGTTPPGVRRKRKSERVVAIGLSLMFTAVTAVAAMLAIFGI